MHPDIKCISMKNPFVTSGYAGKEYFCDRKKETEQLTRMLENENNVALISPRRLGKTELIHHCFAQDRLAEEYYTFIIDIYATVSLQDFVFAFGKAVINTLRSKPRKIWESFINILASLKSYITYDIDGKPVWGLSIGDIVSPSATLDEILHYLETADKPCIVAIDEFQQITKYSNGGEVEATLRTHIQKCVNTHFIFSGSQRHLMTSMFTSPARPFYQSVILFNLKPIPEETYTAFATSHFEKAGKKLMPQVVSNIYNQFESITYYLQRVMNYLYMLTPAGGTCHEQLIDIALDEIMDISTDSYQTLMAQIPEKQRTLLIAIAKEGEAQAISSGSFIKKHHLPSASSVLSAAKGLLEKDLITKEGDTYSVYDLFLRMWICRNIKKT